MKLKDEAFREAVQSLSNPSYSQAVILFEEFGLAIGLFLFLPIVVALVTTIVTGGLEGRYGKLNHGVVVGLVSGVVTAVILLVASPYLLTY